MPNAWIRESYGMTKRVNERIGNGRTARRVYVQECNAVSKEL